MIKKGQALELHQTDVKQKEKGSADYKCNYKKSKKRLHISSLTPFSLNAVHNTK